jgi:small subunit ribosomal protein S8
MSLSDPISNLLTIIRNGLHAAKETVDVPASKLNGRVLDIFKTDGYIEDARLMQTNAQGVYKVYLKYENRKPVISGLKRISSPGVRIYKESRKLPKVLSGYGTAVVSTSKGVLTDREARKANVGGEILCYIW